MTLPWFPFLRGSGLDACVRGVSDAARGVWLLLLCASDDHGNIVGAGAQTDEDVVDAVAGMGTGAHLDELRGMGLVICDVGTVRRLHLPHIEQWREECTPGATVDRPRTATPQTAAHTAAPTSPAATVLRAAERRLRALWSRKGVDTPGARVEWLRSDKGAAFLRRETERGIAATLEWALSLTRTNGDNRGRFASKTATTEPLNGDNSDEGCHRDGDNHGDNSGSSPTPPPPENKEEQREERAGARGDNAATTGDNSNGDNSARPVTTVPCPTVERTTPAPTAEEVLFHLRREGTLRLSMGPTQEKELARALEGVTPAWTLDGVKRLAQHIGAGHLRGDYRPKLDDLRGKDFTWARLLTLYDEAQDCPRCDAKARPAITQPTHGPARSGKPVRLQTTPTLAKVSHE